MRSSAYRLTESALRGVKLWPNSFRPVRDRDAAYVTKGQHMQATLTPNRPAGYIEAICSICNSAAVFVPSGTNRPVCPECKITPQKYTIANPFDPHPSEPAAAKIFRVSKPYPSASATSSARELVARMVRASRLPCGARDIELRSIAAWFDREWDAALEARKRDREKWRKHQEEAEAAEWDMANECDRFE